MADTDYGDLDVEMFTDKICLHSKTNCVKDFAFYTSLNDDIMFLDIGGVIGISPRGDYSILTQLKA